MKIKNVCRLQNIVQSTENMGFTKLHLERRTEKQFRQKTKSFWV